MDRPNKKIKLEEVEQGLETGDDGNKQRNRPPLPSTPDQHGTVDLIDSAISIVVGTGAQKQSFDIHKGLLRHYSGDFRQRIETAEQASINGGKAGPFLLPSDKPEIFKFFRNWLYTPAHTLEITPGSDATLLTFTLIELWGFANRREIPLLANYVVDIFITKFCKYSAGLTVKAVKAVWEHDVHYGGLQDLFSWRAATGYSAFTLATLAECDHVDEEEWYKNFCLSAMHERRGLDLPFYHGRKQQEFNACKFHHHESGVACRRNGGWRAMSRPIHAPDCFA